MAVEVPTTTPSAEIKEQITALRNQGDGLILMMSGGSFIHAVIDSMALNTVLVKIEDHMEPFRIPYGNILGVAVNKPKPRY